MRVWGFEKPSLLDPPPSLDSIGALVTLLPDPLPPPNRLFRMYDAGEISREVFHAAMRVHAEGLIAEMEEARLNPWAAALEEVKRRFAEAKLTRRHNEEDIREIFTALSELNEFPPALHLWNAQHKHVPLRCFFRPSQEPVFRVLDLKTGTYRARITVEYGASAKNEATREEIDLVREADGKLQLRDRKRLA